MMNVGLTAKVNSRGTVWTSKYIRYGVLAYQMERIDSRRNAFALVEPIVVQPSDDGDGWDILLYGDVVHNVHTKSEAQREAEKLLDNPRDNSGWLIENCGRYARPLGRS